VKKNCAQIFCTIKSRIKCWRSKLTSELKYLNHLRIWSFSDRWPTISVKSDVSHHCLSIAVTNLHWRKSTGQTRRGLLTGPEKLTRNMTSLRYDQENSMLIFKLWKENMLEGFAFYSILKEKKPTEIRFLFIVYLLIIYPWKIKNYKSNLLSRPRIQEPTYTLTSASGKTTVWVQHITPWQNFSGVESLNRVIIFNFSKFWSQF
jgi:hypothetical protein